MLGSKGHKKERRHPAFRCAQITVSLGIAEALAGDSVSLRSTGPVHPLARASYRPGLDSRWGSIPPGSAPHSMARTQGAQAAVVCVGVSALVLAGAPTCLSHPSSPAAVQLVSWPSRLICPRPAVMFARIIAS